MDYQPHEFRVFANSSGTCIVHGGFTYLEYLPLSLSFLSQLVKMTTNIVIDMW